MVVEVLFVGGMEEVVAAQDFGVNPPWTSEIDLSESQRELLEQGYMLEEVQ